MRGQRGSFQGEWILVKGEDRLLHYSPGLRDAVVGRLCQALAMQPDLLFAYLHGSFAADGPFRDIDIAVYLASMSLPTSSETQRPSSEPERHPKLRAMALGSQLEVALAEEVKTRIPTVDVRALNAAPLGFCYQVLRRGRLLVSRDEPMRIEWAARVVGRYLDLKPLRERALKEAMTACR